MGKVEKDKDANVTENAVMTNREFINRYCFVEDMPRVLRMVDEAIERKCGLDAPKWVKEKAYDTWLDEEFDRRAWVRSGIEYSDPHSIPRDYFSNVPIRVSARSQKLA